MIFAWILGHADKIASSQVETTKNKIIFDFPFNTCYSYDHVSAKERYFSTEYSVVHFAKIILRAS